MCDRASGHFEGQSRRGHELGAGQFGVTTEERDFEYGSTGASDWELKLGSKERDQLLLTAGAVERNRF
jgi:hypothetical protein